MKITPARSSALKAVPVAFVLCASACAMTDDEQPTTTMTDDEIRVSANARVCDTPADEVQCHARVLVDAFGHIRINAAPAGLGPATLRSFYGITSMGSTSTTVAIV